MKTINCKMTKFVLALASAVVVFSVPATASLSKGSTFSAFFWTQSANDSVKNGCYGYNVVDSVSTKTGTYYSTFWLSNYSWWQKLFTNTYVNTAITTSKSKPAAISKAPDHFTSVEWITGFQRTGSNDSIRFYFPLLPQTAGYGRYDYFTVSVNDTLSIEFYGVGDSVMVGSFVNKKPASNGAINILARNAFILELTKANPLRIKSIRCNSAYKTLLNTYLNFNLATFKDGVAWYGIDIIDTVTNTPKIIVHSIDVEDGSPLFADSTCKIVWKINVPEGVDSCYVDASFDNKRTWTRIGTTGSDSTFMWKIADTTSDSTFFKVTALGKKGENVTAVSMEKMSIVRILKTSIIDMSALLTIVPAFTPVSFNNGLALQYSLPYGIRELSISIFDLKGRRIKQIVPNAGRLYGRGVLQIASKVEAGNYFVRINVAFNDGRTPVLMSKRWINVR